MLRVIMYSEKALADGFQALAANADVRHVGTLKDFVEEIVQDRGAFCGAIQADTAAPDLAEVARSVKRSFPFLHVCFLCENSPQEPMEGVHVVESAAGSESIAESLYRLFAELSPNERRQHNRYSWLLRGRLRIGEEWQALNVSSLSAGGAFLEYEGKPPEPGTVTEIAVRFQNCKLVAECEVLNPREASSNLPFGFGIRFRNLAAESEAALECIVDDALMRAILDEPEQQQAPSIGEESLTFQFELS